MLYHVPCRTGNGHQGREAELETLYCIRTAHLLRPTHHDLLHGDMAAGKFFLFCLLTLFLGIIFILLVLYPICNPDGDKIDRFDGKML